MRSALRVAVFSAVHAVVNRAVNQITWNHFLFRAPSQAALTYPCGPVLVHIRFDLVDGKQIAGGGRDEHLVGKLQIALALAPSRRCRFRGTELICKYRIAVCDVHSG